MGVSVVLGLWLCALVAARSVDLVTEPRPGEEYVNIQSARAPAPALASTNGTYKWYIVTIFLAKFL